MDSSEDSTDFVGQGNGESIGIDNNKYPSLDEFKDEQSVEEYTISRGELNPKFSRDYNGILYRNTFLVNAPILLVGVTFFGPSEEHIKSNTHSIRVTLGVTESNWMALPCKIRKFKPKEDFLNIMKKPEKGQKFRVDFREPIPIQAKMWYDIEFELTGCPTGHMNREKIKTDFVVKSSDGSRNARFQWLRGSCQMPDIHFRFQE